MERLVFFVFGVLIFALFFLTFWLFNFFRNLTKGVGGRNLIEVLNTILKKQEENARNVLEVRKQLQKVDEEGEGHIQKVGFVRFNPFAETGGDHSFSIALLNGKNGGFVITGLHTRERTRVYAKPLTSGKSSMGLSNEEQKALKEALKQ